MIKTYITSLLAAICCIAGVNAQTVYSDPTPLQENSKDVKVYFNAAGTPLAGLKATDKVYAHTGCDLSNGQTWQAAPTWGTNSAKYELTNQGENLWMLYIGDIRSYYGINSSANITRLDFVFRSSDSKTQTPDLFLDVKADGLQISLTSSASGSIITGETGYVKFNVNTTVPAEITLSIDGETIASASNANSLEKDYTFVDPGQHTVLAVAKADGETVEEKLTFHYLGASVKADYPGGIPLMGPVANPDGSVTFCIGAPGKDHMVLLGSWNNFTYAPEQVMSYQETDNGKYFWTTVKGLDPEKMYVYYFVVDGGEYIVGDPYARLVLDPYNDKYLDTNVFPGLPAYPVDALNGQNVPVAIYQGIMNEYDWVVDDFKGVDPSNLIIYELLFRDFTGTEGKAFGNGTVRQAIEKLPYLLDLGVNAIELLPIMEFNGNISWGYNPNFYFAVDKAYGTPDDYKEFIDLCHQNGIAVILDMVFNQSDGMHPWYQMYQWKENPFYNSSFGGINGAPHAYSVLNDWNQDNPMVQEQWADVIKYWMTEYKFDGFRFDLVKGLGSNQSYANASDAATNAYNASRVAEMAYLNSVIRSVNPYGYCINENLAEAKEENEMAADGELNWANVNNAGCQFAMGYSSDSNMNRLYAPLDSRTWGSTVSYLESHDEQRLAYKQDQWGVAGVKGDVKASMNRLGAAAAQMILAPGAHMIWQFSEMGNAQNTKNNDGGNNTDPKIVNWALLDEPNHFALYENYCRLIDIRNSNPDLFAEEAAFTINCGQNNWNNGRWLYSSTNDKELYTLINPNVTGNLTISNVPFKNSDNSAYEIVAFSYESQPSFNAAAGTVTVPPNCFVTIGSTNLNAGIEDVVYEGNVSLKAYGAYGEIVVDYAPAGATIYALDGKVVAKVSESGKVNAVPGVYIVKGGADSLKVIVR